MKTLIRIGMAGMLLCGMLSAAPPQPTNTALTVTVSGTPASASTLGQNVTLTATVVLQSNSSAVTSGSVTFFSGTDPVGAGILNGSGQATFNTTILPGGANALTAFYVGVSGTYAPSKTPTASMLTVASKAQVGFAPPNNVKAGPYPYDVAVGDFNGDGIPDVAIAGFDRDVRVFLGSTSGVFTEVTGSPFTTGGLTFAVVVGDFNGDGLTDIVALTYAGSTTLSVFLNNGQGSFTQSNIAEVSDEPVSMAVGDFNGDGIADLAFANESGGTVGVLLGNGSGGFTAAAKSPFNVGSQPAQIVVADFNGDGNADIATADSNSGTVTILLGDGTGNFKPGAGSPIEVNAGTESPNTLAAADLNGDGYPDLIVGNFSQQTVNVYLNTAASPGHFTQASGSPYNLGQDISQVTVGDFNGDGNLDIASLNGSEFGVISILPGDGHGNFGSPQNYPLALPQELVQAFAAADFNGDGVSDIVTANAQANDTFSIILGTGLTTTTSLMAGPNPSTYGQSVLLTATVSPLATAGDTVTFLSDGVSLGSAPITVSSGVASATLSTSALTGGMHALTATYNGGPVYPASSTPAPISQTVNPAPSTTTLTAAPNPSAAGQGVLLTATATTGATGTVSFYNNATLLATQPLSGGAPNTATYTVSNLASGTNANSITAVYSGDTNYLTSTSNAVNQTVAASPTSTSAVTVTVSGTAATSSEFGKTATLTATVVLQSNSAPVTSGYVTFFSGTDPVGAGTLNGSGQATFNTPLLPAGPNSLSAFYVGVSGAFLPSVSSVAAFTVNSVKQGGFAAPNTFTTGVGNEPYAVAVADFNGDGNADLAIADLVGKSVSVLLGDGLGEFTSATGSPYALSENAYAVAVGDFNGDGRADLAVAISGGSGESFVGILLNTSSGTATATFGSAVNYATGGVNASTAIAVGDFNGDGIADLALANTDDGTVGVTLGKGDGTFTTSNASVKTFTVGGIPNGISAADFNLDGRADIATSNRGVSGAASVTILLNTSTSSSSLSFASAANYPLGTLDDDPLSLAAADFNGDGYPDLAIANYYSSTPNSVSVFLNMGTAGPGHFSEAMGSPYTVGAASLNVVQYVAVGDFNGDGSIDIAALNSAQATFTVLLGDGGGGFSVNGTYAATHPLSNIDFPIAMAVADFNGDGVSDIATANEGNNSASIILGLGTATTTTLMSTPNPSVFGQSVQLTATVTPSATAGDTVTFFADAVSLGSSAITISSGVASATSATSALTGGVHALTATYNGGATFSSSSTLTPTSQTVNPTTFTTILTAAPNPSVSGQGVLLTATVTTGATGTVSFYNNAALLATRPLSGGAPDIATYTVSNLPPGTNSNSITAVYSGDTNYLTSTSNAINQAVTSTTVTSLSLSAGTNPSVTGQSLTFRAAVTPSAATGTITFFDGATQLGVVSLSGGAASYSTSALSAGAHSLTAVYSGDANDAGATSTVLTQNVKAASTTTLTAAPNPSVSGQGVLLTATVTAGATGTVSFYTNVSTLISTQPLSGGTLNAASFTVSNLPPGTNSNSITAVYSGDTNYLTSTSNAINQIVANTTVTSLSLSSGTNPSATGQSLTFRAAVTPSAATGTITFFDGATQLGMATLSGGAASYPTTTLSAGAHSLKAVYSGDTNDAASTSTILTQTVTGSTTTTTLTSAPNPSVSGQGVLLTATVTAGATGTVSFYNNAALLATRPLSGGAPDVATYTVSNLPPGTNSNSITAVYSGDTNYLTSTSNAINQIVANTTVTSLSLSSGTNPSATGQSLTFRAAVTPSAATGTITFFDGATQLGVVGLSGGAASYSTSALSAGAHSLTAVYSGDANDAGATSTVLTQNVKAASATTLTAAPNPSVSGQGVLLTATVTAGATGTVSFYTNVSTLISTQPLSGGNPNTASFTVSNLAAAPSPNSITAVYSGDSNYAASTSNTVAQIVMNTTVTSLSLSSGTNPSATGQGLTFKATVTPSAATGTIAFFDGLTQLGMATLSGGAASYPTTTLSAGAHALKAVYSGDTNDAASTSTILTQTVTGSATTTTLTSAPNPSVSGQGVLLTATVTAGATGTVSFYNNVSTLISTQPLSGGIPNTAAYTVSNLPAAPSTNSITAVYSGDSNFSTGTSNAVNQIVMNTTVTSLSLSSGTNPSTTGQALTFQATVTPSAATGTITFFDGSTQLGQVNFSGGTASYATSALSGGTHSLKAVYGGDTNDATSTSAVLTQTVGTSTITTVTAPTSPVFGQVVTLQASVSPQPASAPFGTVTFYDGATVLGTAALPVSGPASFSTPMLSQGKREIRAHYNGSAAFLPSLSAAASPPVVVASSPQGGFKPEVTYPVSPATIPGAVGTVERDFDGDGNWDLAVITSGAGTPGVEILLGNGNGTFQAPLFYATDAASGTPTAIAAADFNGDGFQDLVVVTGSSIQVLLNNGDGTFGGAIPGSPGAASSLDSIAVADFNGDGFPDVIVGGNGSAATLLGNGNGTLRTATPVPATLSNQVYVVTADFNSDGIADFAVADYSGDLDIFLGTGGGTFGSPAVYSETGNLLSIAAGDINRDGNPDIVLGTTGNNLIVLLSNVAGGFGSPASTALATAGAAAALVTIGDFNGDGILDVAVADNKNGGIYVFPSNGNGTFQSPLSHNTPSGIPNAIMTGNFEGDGFGDIVITDGIEAGVLPGSPILSVNCGAPAGPVVVNVPLTLSCSASGGAAPYTYSISTGSLPPGSPAVSLNASTGSIGGTPNTPGSSTFTVQVNDSSAPAQIAVSASLTINVTAAALTPTATTLSLSSGTNPSTSGQSLTFQATVLPNTATGSVTFFDGVSQLGSGTLSGGIATFTTSALSAGLHSIGATYNGGTNDASSTATALTQTVNQPAPSGPSVPTGPSPPTISTTSLPAGQVGKSYSTVLMATGGSGNYSWSAGTLPQGLQISASGTISGVPAAQFNGQISVSVTDLTSSLSASTLLNLTISAPITITGNSSLGDVAVGASVTASYTVSGGIAPYKFSLTGAPGLSVVDPSGGANGNVRGSASQAGIFAATLTVTDSVNSTSSLTLSIAVLGVSASLPAGTTTAGYSGSVSGVGGVPPYSYAISGVPQGLTVSGGTLSGQVTIEGTYIIGARVTDSNGIVVSQDLSFTITGAAPAGLTIVTASLPDAFVGQAYSQTLEAVGGAPGYTWSKSGGQIPAGLSLSGSGTIFGIPAAPGASIIGVQVSDASGAQIVGTVTINVQPAPLQITNGATFPMGVLAEIYPGQILNATGGTPPYSFSIQGPQQPNARPAASSGGFGIAGLALSQGQIGGTPEAVGSFGFTLVVTDSSAVPATSSLAANIMIEASTPDLILSSASASFALAPGASAPPLPNAITVASSVVSQILTFTTSSSVPWLTVSGSSSTPGSIEVGPNSAALALSADGSPYSGTVTVACTSLFCAGKSHTIAVSLVVAAPPPQLTLGSPLLSFTALASNPQPSPAALSVVNAGGGSLAIQSVAASANWISVGAFPTALAPGPGGSVAISVNPAGLNPGYYLGSVTVTSSAGNATVPVTFFLTGSGTMTLTPSGTQFNLPQGGALAHSGGTFLVGVSSGSANFSASVLPGASWLSGGGTGVASPASPGTVSFSINQNAAAPLPAGFYYGTIRVTGSGVVDSPQDFQVLLNVGPAGSEVIPDPEAAGLVFIGSAALPAQTIQLFGSSANSIEFQTSPTTVDGSGWLTVTPRTGSASASSPAQISVAADPAGLSPGVYQGGVSFAYATSVRTVNVALIVPPGASCTGTQPVATQTGLVSNFSVPASLPVPLGVQLRDTCGNTIGNAQIVTTFSNGDPPLVLSPVDTVNGVYSGTWTPRNTSSQVILLTTASAPGYTTATTQTPGQVAPDSAPVLVPTGTLDVFNPQVGAGLAPGNIVQIYGSGLAGQATASTVLPLPTAVNGTSVTIGGLNAPLYYVSPGQINAQVPFELAAGNQYQVVVNANGALTTPQPIQLTQADPAVLQYNSGEVVAQHHDGTLIQDSSPAAPGEFVTIYLSGLGATNGPVPSGAPSPGNPLANVADTPTLTLNGAQVPVLFGGLTPTLVGLYQIDFQVPQPLANGNYTLSIAQSGTSSNNTVLPVKN